MLAILLTILMFSQGLTLDNCGTSFITAFPENIAVYYRKTYNLFKITTLHPSTTISVTYVATGNVTTNTSLGKGIVWTVNLTKQVEESQFMSSNKTFRITSDKNITVLSVSGWEGRFQTHVVQPDQNLGKVYQVPSLNYTAIAKSFNLTMTSYVRFMPFRLMIINAVDRPNSVTIKRVDEGGQSQEDTITLDPYNLYQIRINGSVREINSGDKVAVILTHPCFDSKNCSCNMILNQLQAYESNNNNDNFLVPPIFSASQLLVTTNQPFQVCQGCFTPNTGVLVEDSVDILPLLQSFKNNISLISTTIQVSLRLISPGLILDLIPISKFSGCYLVDLNISRSAALVIANTSSTTTVRKQNQLLAQIKWNIINGTGYSWALVEGEGISTIWHPFEKIGVYVIERLESNNTYGRAATVISTHPDNGGCLVTPEMFVLGKDEMTWFRSREYCIQNGDLFARLNSESSQSKMASNMTLEKPTEGWISLRRGLYSTEWYWKTEDASAPNMDFTYWENGQPEKPEKGLCASVFLDPDKKFKWKSARCCSKKKPVCYKRPIYFTQ